MDIFSMYTKEQNIKAGRTGYSRWKSEKEVFIRPADYGRYLRERKGGFVVWIFSEFSLMAICLRRFVICSWLFLHWILYRILRKFCG